MKSKDKIKLRIYEDEVKNMPKKEIVNQIRRKYDLKDLYDTGNDFATTLIAGGVVCAAAAIFFGITDCSDACAITSIIAAGVTPVGIGINMHYSKKDEINNRYLDVLFNYVDSDEDKKEKDNTKTLNS